MSVIWNSKEELLCFCAQMELLRSADPLSKLVMVTLFGDVTSDKDALLLEGLGLITDVGGGGLIQWIQAGNVQQFRIENHARVDAGPDACLI